MIYNVGNIQVDLRALRSTFIVGPYIVGENEIADPHKFLLQRLVEAGYRPTREWRKNAANILDQCVMPAKTFSLTDEVLIEALQYIFSPQYLVAGRSIWSILLGKPAPTRQYIKGVSQK